MKKVYLKHSCYCERQSRVVFAHASELRRRVTLVMTDCGLLCKTKRIKRHDEGQTGRTGHFT